MKERTKRTFGAAFFVIVLGVTPFAFREIREWREIREERTLEKIVIDSLEIKDATFDEALQVVAEKLRAMGHPEVRLHIYENGGEVPYFHPRLEGYGFTSEPLTNLKVVPDGANGTLIDNGGSAGGLPVTLHDVLWHIGFRFQLPCALHGHDLVAAHTPGSLRRYVHERIRLDTGFLATHSNEELARGPKEWGICYYEGMTIQFRRDQQDVDFVGPCDQFDLLEADLRPHPGSRWEELKFRLWDWRSRLLPF